MRREHFTRWTFAAAMTGALTIVVIGSPVRVEAIGFCSHAISAASHHIPRARHQLVHTRQYDGDRTPGAAPRRGALLPHARRNDGGSRSKHPSSAAVERIPSVAPPGRRVRATVVDVAVLALPEAVFHDAHAPPCRQSSSAGALS
jgi:hypothetical protein